MGEPFPGAYKRQTLPVLFGYLFWGFAFGISLAQAGYTWVWALGIGLTVYAGSMQFVLVSLLSSGASLLAAATMTIVITSRHMFYGLSFLSRFPAMGALTGQLLPVDFTGIDFSMTALFVVLFIEQYKAQIHPLPALLGLSCALDCLLVFGTSHFIVPALHLWRRNTLLSISVGTAVYMLLLRLFYPCADTKKAAPWRCFLCFLLLQDPL